MNVPLLTATCTLLAAAVGILGALRGWWETPERKAERDRNAAANDAILGEAEVPDRAGGVLQVARPGLVERMSRVEEAIVDLRHLIGLYTETQKRIDGHDQLFIDHGRRLGEHSEAIAALIASTFERGATAALDAEKARAAKTQAATDADVIDEPPST